MYIAIQSFTIPQHFILDLSRTIFEGQYICFPNSRYDEHLDAPMHQINSVKRLGRCKKK